MYNPYAPRSLISYMDMRARNIHVSTAMENNEEILELKQGLTMFATTKVKDDDLYKIVINLLTCSAISLIDDKEVSMVVWTGDPEAKCRNMAQGLFLDTIAKPHLWHMRLEHPSTTVFT
jgi:hypothetical protein